MSKAEILAELTKLMAEELAEVQARLDELAGETWLDGGELTDPDKVSPGAEAPISLPRFLHPPARCHRRHSRPPWQTP